MTRVHQTNLRLRAGNAYSLSKRSARRLDPPISSPFFVPIRNLLGPVTVEPDEISYAPESNNPVRGDQPLDEIITRASPKCFPKDGAPPKVTRRSDPLFRPLLLPIPMLDLQNASDMQRVYALPHLPSWTWGDTVNSHCQRRNRMIHPIAQHQPKWRFDPRQPRGPVRFYFAILDSLRPIDDLSQRFAPECCRYRVHSASPR